MSTVLDTIKCERCRYARGVTKKRNENDSKFKKLIIEERFKMLGMFPLRRRRLRGNTIEMFKRIHSIDREAFLYR